MKRNLLITIIFVFLFCVIVPVNSYAGGLSTYFIKAKMTGLEPGKTYNVKQLTNNRLIVINTSDTLTLSIKIEPRVPAAGDLTEGYEAIPDASWVKIEKDSFDDVKPGKYVESEITVTIPEGTEHCGKRYQVDIYSHTAGAQTFRVGIMSKILIETKAK